MNYILHIAIMINIYTILTLSTNLIVGMVNLLSIGQAAFYGVGAYLTAYALLQLGMPFLPALVFALLATAVLGFIIGIVSLKLDGDYFILSTLGFQIIIYSILYNWISVTAGPYGIGGIVSPKILGIIDITDIMPFFIISTLLTLLVVFIFKNLIESPFGRVLKCIRDDEIGVLSLGRNVYKFKIMAFIISSAFCGVSGFLYASYITYIDPTSFGLDESIFILSAVIIGGTGNIKGPIVGAVFAIMIPELLRFTNIPDNIAANMRMIIYGFCLIILMRYRVQGLAGSYKI